MTHWGPDDRSLRERLRWVAAAARQRGRDDNFGMPCWQQVCYTAKAIVLLVIAKPRPWQYRDWRDEVVEIAYRDERQWAGAEMTCYAWRILDVGYGWRPRTWWYRAWEENAP